MAYTKSLLILESETFIKYECMLEILPRFTF